MRTLPIGEVLKLLKPEFEDVTISKIRFLEAEGLIQPDRTPAGYRRFTDEDVERLRWILTAQRDRYLPLKVIRDELGDPARELVPPLEEARGATPAQPSLTDVVTAAADRAEQDATTPTDVRLSGRELAEAAGVEEARVRGLQEHGILPPGDIFDGTALLATRAAATLMEAGLEPRHLRMYRQFADREVALLQQLVTPVLRQRNPQARRRASEVLDAVSDAGARLHRALLAGELTQLLRGEAAPGRRRGAG